MAVVQWIQNRTQNALKNRLTIAERADLRKRLEAYEMELHDDGGHPRRWHVTKKDPLLSMLWVLSWNGHPKRFWRLRRILEFLNEAENHQLPKGVWSWILPRQEFKRLKDVDEFLRQIEAEKSLETRVLQAVKDAGEGDSS